MIIVNDKKEVEIMKAVIYERYGSYDELKYTDIPPKPEPKDDEVQIKVHAVSLNISDVLMLKGTPYMVRLWSGISKPKNQVLALTSQVLSKKLARM